MIDALLGEAGAALGSFDAIAFGAGPGSFTGLRIACGVAQGLAFAAGLPVADVSTLLAVALASGAERVVSCLDARMGEVYYAAFELGDQSVEGRQWRVVHPPQLCAPAGAPPVDGEGWVGAGSGFAVHGPALLERYGGRLSAVRPELHPHAREIAALGAERVRAGLALPAEEAHPLYLRDRVALTVDERRALKAAQGAHAPAENP